MLDSCITSKISSQNFAFCVVFAFIIREPLALENLVHQISPGFEFLSNTTVDFRSKQEPVNPGPLNPRYTKDVVLAAKALDATSFVAAVGCNVVKYHLDAELKATAKGKLVEHRFGDGL